MKKLLFFVGIFAAFIIGDKIYAEFPTPTGIANYRLYRSSDVSAGTNKIENGAFLRKIIVSSAAAVDFSTAAVLDIYNSRAATSNKIATIQLSTNEVTGMTEWAFDTYLSSGLTVNHSTGNASGDVAGAVQVIYTKGVQENTRVYSSSFMVVDVSTYNIAPGPVLLQKISVLKKGNQTSGLRVYDQYSVSVPSNVATNKIIANIDLVGGGAREYLFNTVLSSGIAINAASVGTIAPEIAIFYKRNPSYDYEYWQSTGITGTTTNKALFAGKGTFGGVLVTSATATSTLTVYDSNGTDTNKKAVIDGGTISPLKMFDVTVSSGLTVTSVGTAKFTLLYRRIR